MNILNDTEHRLFLSAIEREKRICKEFDKLPDNGMKLLPVCRSIEKKVNEAIIQRTGRWKEKRYIPPLSDSTRTAYTCSECNTTWEYEFNYCPNCGAKMTNIL